MSTAKINRYIRFTTRVQAISASVLLLFAANANAQGTPAYVVSSQRTISTTVSGPAGNIAVNSRGDLFVNVGNDSTNAVHVYEFPASGAAPIAIFTEPGNACGSPPGQCSYGATGVAVDSKDNLYVTNFFGPGGNNNVDSMIYELPFTNGSYPAPYIYAPGSPPGSCNPAVPATGTTPAIAANTGVCAYGQYTSATNYYYQPIGIAVDGLGNSYMYTNYDNVTSGGKGIFFCNVLCGQQGLGANAYALVVGLPNKIVSIAADATGDVFFVDGTNNVSEVVNGATAVSVFDASFLTATGITFDKAGNLYVTDSTGIYEVPSVGGKLNLAGKFQVLPNASGGPASAAVDSRGNLYYAPSYGNLNKVGLWSGTFPAAPVGTASAALTLTVAFHGATTLGSITALQGTAPATEFVVSPGSCAAGAAFSLNTSCTFTVTFTPSAVGVRSGSIVIADSTGATTTTYLTGSGTGTGVTVDPGTPSAIGANLKTPSGVAIDAVGNVYVTDAQANAVYAYPAGGGAGVSIGSGLNAPTGVAVDGAGNVFIVNHGSGTVVEVPSVNGVATTSAQSTVFTGLKSPTDIVIDGDGNFFITNTGNNEVLQYPSVSRYGSATTSVSLGAGLNAPTGLALDLTGQIYVADTGNNRVVEIGDGFQTVIGGGLSAPTGVAVEPSGSVLIADQGTGRLIRIPNETLGGLNASDQVVLDSPLNFPYALRLDSTGNLYASDNQAGQLYELQRTGGLVSFGNYNLNTSSGPATIVLSSTGTLPLTLGSPLFAAVPASSGFTVTAGPAVTACAGTTLAAGANCTLSAVFTPTATGAVTYPLTLAAPGLNAAAPTVKLSGAGANLSAATVTIAQTSPTGALNYGVPIVVSVSVSPSSNTTTPTGLVVFSFDGQNQRPVALNSKGVASITFSGVQAGAHTVQGHYEGDANYAAVETAALPLNINRASVTTALTISADAAQPLSSAPGDGVGFSVTLQPSTPGLFQGTVNFMNGSTVLGTATVSGPDPKTGLYTAFLNILTLQTGTYNVMALYSGNANYAASASATIPLVITPPTFTVTTNTSSVTASAGSPGVATVTITSYSAFQGGVDFSCAGLPANAYCVFRPGLASLLSAPNTTPFTIFPLQSSLQIRVDQDPAVIASATSFGWIGAVLAVVLFLYVRRRRPTRGLVLTILLVLAGFGGVASLGGCSGASSSNNFPTPAGTYPITVTAVATPIPPGQGATLVAANNITTTFKMTLTVK